ncbi:MAG: hypothetical protein A2408_03350 [Candidatus Yonathbacteria bacterium RIFOXYC1_FULL_52_10]|uniref:Uncharacterized protein n=1 Tax=Candidatus Yonathbacteria bacterium RIFOXYD1_FULL_52_36 TaxID=1802730 RepID=A0A1G2SM42_9BACT|nr:MAG: hypothetical protein A2408_03350 [Candidatus Yonathbacteria bacterium RIFOXYC1_FULL_52_10]OHA85729.1 MAG: hypothetical protein A2591_02130 [Candidatus Yonathbacteria bacterium RIFOXYD1_FULL_52_36]
MASLALDYARALASALDQKDSARAGEMIARFVALVRRRGHARLLPKIVTAFERDAHVRARANQAHVTVADEAVIKDQARSIAEHAQTIGVSSKDIAFTIDDTLITGYRIRTRDKIVDVSGKRALLEIYRRMVTT